MVIAFYNIYFGLLTICDWFFFIYVTAAIHNLEQEVGIADRIAVLTDVIEWMRPSDLDKAKELTSLFDAYIKDKL